MAVADAAGNSVALMSGSREGDRCDVGCCEPRMTRDGWVLFPPVQMSVS